MPAHYCALHARLWSLREKGWIDFSSEQIALIRKLFRVFQRCDIATPEYSVIEMECDRCAQKALQEFQEKFKTGDPLYEASVSVVFYF